MADGVERRGADITAAELLQLDTVGERHFRSRYNLENNQSAIFGGQPLVQGLAAARRTVSGWPAHTLTGYFLSAGAPAIPVDYIVEPVRDGRRFAVRRVLASQHGKPIFDMECSFHDHEPGPHHQLSERPASPPPDTLADLPSFLRANAHRLSPDRTRALYGTFPIELRPVDPGAIFLAPLQTAQRNFWFRLASAADIADPLDQQCLLAFMADFWLAGTPAAPHFKPNETAGLAVVSLNHSMWFHAPIHTGSWLMYQTDSPWVGEGRGLARGMIYDEAGRLGASVMQEISIRRRSAASPSATIPSATSPG